MCEAELRPHPPGVMEGFPEEEALKSQVCCRNQGAGPGRGRLLQGRGESGGGSGTDQCPGLKGCT